MHKIYNTKIPTENPYTYIRLFSKDNISYFSKADTPFLSKEMIDKVDPPLRILSNVLLEKGCRVVSFFAPTYKTKDEINQIWNKIKREEKLIRTESIKLYYVDGSSIDYKDPSYRTYWPSNEALQNEYMKDCDKSWFVFDVPQEFSGSLKTRKDLIETKISNKSLSDGYERFTIYSENAFTEYDWRRYSQTILDLIALEKEGLIQ